MSAPWFSAEKKVPFWNVVFENAKIANRAFWFGTRYRR
jgi:hypothetical protein